MDCLINRTLRQLALKVRVSSVAHSFHQNSFQREETKEVKLQNY